MTPAHAPTLSGNDHPDTRKDERAPAGHHGDGGAVQVVAPKELIAGHNEEEADQNGNGGEHAVILAAHVRSRVQPARRGRFAAGITSFGAAPYRPSFKNRLIPGLKITFPSTTTSSSSRKSCTAFDSTFASSSRPLRFTSSSESAPTLMWNTSCKITGPSSSCSVTKWAVHPCTRTPDSNACLYGAAPGKYGSRLGWMLMIRCRNAFTSRSGRIRMYRASTTTSAPCCCNCPASQSKCFSSSSCGYDANGRPAALAIGSRSGWFAKTPAISPCSLPSW